VIDADGRVIVAASEGYLHVLDARGGFAWSHVLEGGAAGAPAVGADGTIFVGTTQGRLHAIRSNGRQRWVYRVPEPIVTDVVAGPHDLLYFGLADGSLYAMASKGYAVWQARVGAVRYGPAVLASGEAVVASDESELTLLGPLRQRAVAPLPAPLSAAPLAAGGGLLLLAGDELLELDADRRTVRSRRGVRSAALVGQGQLVYLELEGRLVWASLDHGEEVASVRPRGRYTAVLAGDRRGFAYLGRADGGLDAWSAEGTVRPLLGPHHDPPRHLVVDEGRGQLVVARTSEVLALPLRGKSLP
jgi:hypothetical protein